MSAEAEPSAEELHAADALVRVLDGDDAVSPLAETLARLGARRQDIDADLGRVRARVLRRARRKPAHLVVPLAMALAAGAAIVIGTARPRPAPIAAPEPDIALLEAQVKAASERGLRADLDVEAWRYRRRLFASIERRYDR